MLGSNCLPQGPLTHPRRSKVPRWRSAPCCLGVQHLLAEGVPLRAFSTCHYDLAQVLSTPPLPLGGVPLPMRGPLP
eukprot:4245821-Amphidinium_carterae.2